MLSRNKLHDVMLETLVQTMAEEGSDDGQSITMQSPLLTGAVVTSIGLVSMITEIEMRLDEEFEIEVTLVSEEALSRKHSPFQNLEALADYIFELAKLPERNP